MNIATMLSPRAIETSASATTKKQVLQQLAKIANRVLDLDEKLVFSTLRERERLGSTVLGEGIAVPHGRFDALDECHLLVLRLDTPIQFDEDDEGQSVDLVCSLLAPNSTDADCHKALALVTRELADPKTIERLRNASINDELYNVLTSTGKAADLKSGSANSNIDKLNAASTRRVAA